MVDYSFHLIWLHMLGHRRAPHFLQGKLVGLTKGILLHLAAELNPTVLLALFDSSFQVLLLSKLVLWSNQLRIFSASGALVLPAQLIDLRFKAGDLPIPSVSCPLFTKGS